ncbi:MAG TPA: hypothetical protein VF733_02700 [Candidatus Saccharimonadales bacterium]
MAETAPKADMESGERPSWALGMAPDFERSGKETLIPDGAYEPVPSGQSGVGVGDRIFSPVRDPIPVRDIDIELDQVPLFRKGNDQEVEK